jgi:CheY-like chemotaxis protein
VEFDLTTPLIEDMGYKIRAAAGGAAALATLAAEPSIVTMPPDVQMPLVNGYELADGAKALAHHWAPRDQTLVRMLPGSAPNGLHGP